MKSEVFFGRFAGSFFLISLLTLAISTMAVAETLPKCECSQLTNLKIASTNLISATVVPAGDGLPEYCRVTGYVRPSINFEVKLTTSNWNSTGRRSKGQCHSK